jgi:16S rRNA (uracil1498-N3)-methyltransferase
VHLIQALLKGDRWEWLLEKAVELGATRITPVVTGHTVARPGEGRSGDKLERWRKRALAAAKQCERGIVPEIDPPVPLDKFLKTLPAPEEGESRRAFLERAGEEPPAPAHPGAVIRLAVGPEGGWTEQEIAQLAAAGFRGAGLGPRILRGETAALAALVLASLG